MADDTALAEASEARLALLAAVASDNARNAWNTLMDRMPFDAIAEQTQRVVPAIYVNLQDEPDVSERDRLRGAYKYAWVRNQQLLHAVLPVLDAFTAAGIAYRVTKGVAILATTQRIGGRVMADIDIVLAASDSHRAQAIIEAHGFRGSDGTVCPQHRARTTGDALNFNRGPYRIDLHLTPLREPRRLFDRMLSEPAQRCEIAGIGVDCAQPVLLTLHAMNHGLGYTSPTDQMQALVDVQALTPLVDRTALARTAETLRMAGVLTQFQTALARMLDTPATYRPGVRQHAIEVIDGVASVLPRTNGVVRRLWDRRLPAGSLDGFDDPAITRTWMYRQWLQAGRTGRVERQVIGRLGGFLAAPSERLPARSTSQPFVDAPAYLTTSTSSGTTLDWRLRLAHGHPRADIVMCVDDPSLDRLDAYVFVNGSFVTKIVAGDVAGRTVYLRAVPSDTEVSIRPMTAACQGCYAGLDTMRVDLEVVRVLP